MVTRSPVLSIQTCFLRKLPPSRVHSIASLQRAVRGNSIFGVNSTFKTNHFLGYSVALNRLDGVYYVDPRPEMIADERLRREISSFQHFLIHDLWTLTK